VDLQDNLCVFSVRKKAPTGCSKVLKSQCKIANVTQSIILVGGGSGQKKRKRPEPLPNHTAKA
jgi:hypothetical protein